jgi:hypothetical protein
LVRPSTSCKFLPRKKWSQFVSFPSFRNSEPSKLS